MRGQLLVKLLLCLNGAMIGMVSSFAPTFVSEGRRRRKLSSSKRKSLDRHNAYLLLEDDDNEDTCDRRQFLREIISGSTVAAIVTSGSTFSPQTAEARGLVSFPCKAPLLNVYHFMRAGTSLLEEEDIISTNPLFLTNREAALSEKGVEQAQAASRILQEADISPSVIKYSLAASSVDTAMVLRDELKVGQNRLIPEFTFMDPRAIGKWDMMSMAETFPALVAMDELEAGNDGKGARPPPNTDGTPQDTLADQAIRLRQLMSVLETQFSGDNIVLVFPDGSGPALLSAMIAGIPYNKAHVLEFAPGEIRLDVTMTPTLQLYESKLQGDHAKQYNALIEEGKVELKRLRSMNDEDIVSKKDMMIEKERVAIEEEYQQREQERLDREESERQARLARLEELERTRLKSRGISVDDYDGTTTTPNADASIPQLVIGGALAAYAVISLSSAGQDTRNDPRTRSNAATSTSSSTPSGDNTILMDLSDAPGLAISPSMNTTSANSSPTAAAADLFADMLNDYQVSSQAPSTLYDTPQKSQEERNDDARKAMQDYMDQDDGGDDWLQTMATILEEDDEDDIFVISDDDEDTAGSGTVNGSSDKL